MSVTRSVIMTFCNVNSAEIDSGTDMAARPIAEVGTGMGTRKVRRSDGFISLFVAALCEAVTGAPVNEGG
jgi:hypothetical protein